MKTASKLYINYLRGKVNNVFELYINNPISEFYEYSFKDLFDIWELVTCVIKGEDDINDKYIKLNTYDEEFITFSVLMEEESVKMLYKLSIYNRKIRSESLYYNDNLLISIDRTSNIFIPEVGVYWWRYVSKYDPIISYEEDSITSILYQPELLDIYEKITNVLYLKDDVRESSINLLKDEHIFSEFKRILPLLWTDIKEVTDDLKFITITGNELNVEIEGSGFNRVFDILPYIIHSYLYGSTLLIPYLNQSLHPNLLKYIKDLYIKLNHTKNKGHIITYVKG